MIKALTQHYIDSTDAFKRHKSYQTTLLNQQFEVMEINQKFEQQFQQTQQKVLP